MRILAVLLLTNLFVISMLARQTPVNNNLHPLPEVPASLVGKNRKLHSHGLPKLRPASYGTQTRASDLLSPEKLSGIIRQFPLAKPDQKSSSGSRPTNSTFTNYYSICYF